MLESSSTPVFFWRELRCSESMSHSGDYTAGQSQDKISPELLTVAHLIVLLAQGSLLGSKNDVFCLIFQIAGKDVHVTYDF